MESFTFLESSASTAAALAPRLVFCRERENERARAVDDDDDDGWRCCSCSCQKGDASAFDTPSHEPRLMTSHALRTRKNDSLSGSVPLTL